MHGRKQIGLSGYDYPQWRGDFYPTSLPRKQWLAHVGQRFSTLELNGTFYSLKKPAHYERWARETPPSSTRQRLGS